MQLWKAHDSVCLCTALRCIRTKYLLSGSQWLAGLRSCVLLARDNSSLSHGVSCVCMCVQLLEEMQVLFDTSILQPEETDTFRWV